MSEFQPKLHTGTAIHAVVAVVDSGQRDKVLRIYRADRVLLDFVCMCHGTARTELLEVLGLGETAKVLVFCLTNAARAHSVLRDLSRALDMRYPGRGIAFSVPVGSIGARMHQLLTKEEDQTMQAEQKQGGYDVVAAIIEQGYTDRVMEAARREGARGGTVISARGLAENEVGQFLGIQMQAEKEIVFLVVRSDERQRIMSAIMKTAGLRTDSHGVVLSLPVSEAIGLADRFD